MILTDGTSIQFENDVQFDGECITVWAVAEQHRIKCKIPRATIDSLPIFRDLVTREINRDRREIVDRLRTVLVAKLGRAKADTVELLPQDLI
jgi:hypothetical protein